MILCRFTKHITEQNWFAVGLDVIVVVVGIFLGMQVTDWNEQRKEKVFHQLYIERLSRDINYDLSSAKAHANYFKRVKAYGEKVYTRTGIVLQRRMQTILRELKLMAKKYIQGQALS